MTPTRLALTLLFAASPLLADVGIDRGGNFGNLESREEPSHPEQARPTVEMSAEEVTLVLTPVDLRVEAVFHMKNTGKEDARLKLYFPGGSSRDVLQDFCVSRDAKRFDVTLRDALSGSPRRKPGEAEWNACWNAAYPAGKTVTETVRYRTEHKVVAPGYFLHTGADWDGAIGRAQITLRLEGMDDLPSEAVSPKGFTRKGNTFTWDLRNLEPTAADDIRIAFDAKQEILKTVGTLEEKLKKAGEDTALLTDLLWATRDAVALGAAEPKDSVRAGERLLAKAGEPLTEDALIQLGSLLHQAIRAKSSDIPFLTRLVDLLASWQEGRLKTRAGASALAHGWTSPGEEDRARLQADLKTSRELLERKKGEEKANGAGGDN